MSEDGVTEVMKGMCKQRRVLAGRRLQEVRVGGRGGGARYKGPYSAGLSLNPHRVSYAQQ